MFTQLEENVTKNIRYKDGKTVPVTCATFESNNYPYFLFFAYRVQNTLVLTENFTGLEIYRHDYSEEAEYMPSYDFGLLLEGFLQECEARLNGIGIINLYASFNENLQKFGRVN